jgi:hypothetical protein
MGAAGSEEVGAGLLDLACDFVRLRTCAGRSVGKLYFVVMRVWGFVSGME